MKYAFYGKKAPERKIPSMEYDNINPDIVFSFGGDGTMLDAIHAYEEKADKIKFVGIKHGNLGFFYSFENNDLEKAIAIIEKNEYLNNYYPLLKYELIGESNITGYAINELAITNPIHTQIIDVYINDLLFEEFRGSGFIAAPPTGSTAFSRSCGGSIIDPLLEAYELVEIASINNRLYKTISSPLVLSKKYTITLKMINNTNLYISVDGNEIEVKNIREIKVSLSNKKVNIVSIEDFFEKVRKAFLE